MPRYEYKCRECGIEFEISHSMKEKMSNCETCKTEGSLFRVVTSFAVTGLTRGELNKNKKPGKIVNEFIEKTKKEVSQYRDELSRGMVDMDEVDK